jgi:hypothetical protein
LDKCGYDGNTELLSEIDCYRQCDLWGWQVTDWMNDGFAIQADNPDEMVYPPRVLLGLAGLFVLLSAIQLVPSFDHRIGYVTALIAASFGGIVAVADQKKRASYNYINYGWFDPTLRAIRYLALGAAAGNIAYLAIDAWQGRAIF